MSTTATIGTLRLRSQGVPGPAQRVRLESRLARAELEPPSLPPSAILIVRTISSRSGPDGATDWSELRRQLDALHRRATRPGRQTRPSAPAVLFESEAELAACFAMDVIDHVATERWWWRYACLRPGISPVAQLAVYLAEHPGCLPGALKSLAEAGYLVAVARLFTRDQSTVMLRALTQVFELDDSAVRPMTVDGTGDAPTTSGSDRAAPPWRAWLSGAAIVETLPPETCLLVATALGLVIAPREVRHVSFGREAAAWLASRPSVGSRLEKAVDQPEPTVAQGTSHPVSAPQSVPQHELRPSPTPSSAAEATEAAGVRVLEPVRSEPRSSLRTVVTDETVGAVAHGASPDPLPIPEQPMRSIASPHEPSVEPARGVYTPMHDRERSTATSAVVDPGDFPPIVSHQPALPAFDADSVPTSLAGAFYLINLVLRLDRPGRLETTNDAMEALGPWGTLEAIALGILDSLPEAAASWDAWSADLLWTQLTMLDGRRPGRRLGHGLPETALEPLAAWTKGSARARVHRVGPAASRRVDPVVRRWLTRLVPYLRGQLAAAAGTDPDDAIRLIVLRTGRLYVTRTHVDVVMALDNVSGQVRRAGLDIDPGWQPRYGRVIKFHYR